MRFLGSQISGVRFELFYWDYSFGRFLGLIILGLTLGMVPSEGTDTFLENLFSAKMSFVLLQMGAGVLNNVGSFCMTSSIAIAGLSVTFPIANGTGLVFGTFINYLADPKGSLLFLVAGSVFALSAIICLTFAYRYRTLQQHQKQAYALEEMTEICQEENGEDIEVELKEKKRTRIIDTKDKSAVIKGVFLCVMSGVFSTFWSPMGAIAMRGEGRLNPYTVLLYTYIGGLFCCVPLTSFFMRYPLTKDPPLNLSSYLSMTRDGHLWGFFAGFIVCVGTVLYLISSKSLGFAVTYAIAQGGPLISSLFGLFVWKEFDGVERKTKIMLISSFVLYTIAITLVALAK